MTIRCVNEAVAETVLRLLIHARRGAWVAQPAADGWWTVRRVK